MKKIFLAALLAVLAVTGCRTKYQLTLNNGNQVTTANKPKLVNGYYVFKDLNGQTNYVSQTRVRAIEPQPRGYKGSTSTTYQR